jgi:predicted ATPase/class 3 adenylate cyclase
MAALFSFGEWLKQRRSALLLSRDQLAQQVGCAEITLRKIEADERRPSLAIAERLADLLELRADERTLFLQVARGLANADGLPPPIPRGVAPSSLPSSPLAPMPPSGTVTFLFTDIEGSTKLWEQHPHLMQQALARHDALLHASIAAHGGAVVKSTGDGLLAVFARATDAIQAAIDAQRSLAAEAWGTIGALQVRMALHTGVAEKRDGDYFGPPLKRVARLLSAGHGGQILLSLATTELMHDHMPTDANLRDLGVHRLKDLSRPEQIFQLLAPDLSVDFPPLNTLNARRTSLPAQPTALLGREQEMAAVCALLRRPEVRLVTLTGPGGTGKTRLGLQVAAELADSYADGVYFVNLAPISAANLVTSAIAQTLGVTETGDQPLPERLQSYLRDKRLLLLLDNFEQIVDAAPPVAELLAACPNVKVLVTSRVPLHLRGEKEIPVQPLALPDLHQLPLAESLTQYAAVELFIQRALDARPNFVVTNENAPAVAEICARLDGLPLVIELAAARIKLFTPEALLAQLSNRLTLLTGGARDLPARQQTLRHAIDWSYDLLAAAEQALFRRLSVFVGGWTLEAAEAVSKDRGAEIQSPSAPPHAPAFDLLAALVDKSLVGQLETSDSTVRFTMLETIREYALDRLESSGEGEALRRRHAEYFLALVEMAEPELIGPRQRVWLDRLERDFDNLRATVEWSLSTKSQELSTEMDRPLTSSLPHPLTPSPAELAARLCVALYQFWLVRRSHIAEGIGWLERALARADALPAALRAWMLFITSDLYGRVGAHDAHERAKQPIVESLALFRELGDRRGIAAALIWAGQFEDDAAQAVACWQESLALARELGDRSAVADVLLRLGFNASDPGDYARAGPLLEEALSLYRALDHPHGVAGGLLCLGRLHFYGGDYATARGLNEERLAIEKELDNASGIADSLHWLGLIAFAQGDVGRARALLEESLALRRALGLKEPIARALTCLGHVAAAQGDAAPARALLEEGLALHRGLGDQRDSCLAIAGFAALAAARGEWERAARLLGAAKALGAHLAIKEPEEQVFYERLAAARATQGEAAFAVAIAEGQALTLEQAIAEALGEDG